MAKTQAPRQDPLGLGATLHQIGIVVRDLEQGMAHYRQLLGLGPFMTMRTQYEARFRDWRGTIANRNAFAKWGDLYLEMVEPDAGQGVHRHWLETRGEGIFHLGFVADDISVRPADVEVAFESLDDQGKPRVIMLDTVELLGYYVELAGHELVTTLNKAIDAFAAENTA